MKKLRQFLHFSPIRVVFLIVCCNKIIIQKSKGASTWDAPFSLKFLVNFSIFVFDFYLCSCLQAIKVAK